MPFKSEKQRKFMFAKHPEIAERWAREGKANVVADRKAPKRAAAMAKKAVAKKVADKAMRGKSKGEGRYSAKPVLGAAKKAASKQAPKRAASYKRSK